MSAEKENAVVMSNEQNLGSEISIIERRANGIVVSNDSDYESAAELTKEVKRMSKMVTEYWEPLRIKAKESYDAVLSRKKAMTSPLDSAEKILKQKMGEYTLRKERERRAKEEELRKEIDKIVAEIEGE